MRISDWIQTCALPASRRKGESVMRNLDFSSWQSIGATLIGLALVTLIGVGIRLIVMMTIQQRRERMNRQINERLRVLIAARSEEHTSELQSLMRISYAVFCLKQKNNITV